jgi:hypothetical protein
MQTGVPAQAAGGLPLAGRIRRAIESLLRAACARARSFPRARRIRSRQGKVRQGRDRYWPRCFWMYVLCRAPVAQAFRPAMPRAGSPEGLRYIRTQVNPGLGLRSSRPSFLPVEKPFSKTSDHDRIPLRNLRLREPRTRELAGRHIPRYSLPNARGHHERT